MKPENDPFGLADLNFPVFDVPQKEHWPMFRPLEWIMDEMEPQRRLYMERYDTPEKRLRTKNPEPFRLHGPEDPPASR